MHQSTISELRRQFLGLHRVLSTVTSLVTDGLVYDDDIELMGYAARLLITNHNFQNCSVHFVDNDTLRMAAGVSADGDIGDSENQNEDIDWIQAHLSLATRAVELDKNHDTDLLQEKSSEGTSYSKRFVFRDEVIGVLTVSSPAFDHNHAHLISVFCTTLTSLMVNCRQNHHLNNEVRRRTVELENAWRDAQDSSDAKSRFLTNMSHEFLTPLNSIVGAGSLISDTELTTEQSELTETVMASSRHLQSMVNDMLDYSLMEEDELELNVVKTDLRLLVQSLCETVQSDGLNKDVRFVINVDEQIPEFVTVDAKRLEQILSNLISNAIKFTARGCICVDVCNVGNMQSDVLARFSVTDTGIGIDENDIDHIFDALHQLDSSGTRDYGGTGLGLAISQRVARLLGSEIKVDSEPGEGSQFYFDLQLPCERPEAVGGESTEHEFEIAGTASDVTQNIQPSVLLVEDNLINQKFAAKLLEKMGCTVRVANDGIDAVRMFGEDSYDVIFMDCQNP